MIEYNEVLGGLSEEEKKEALKILQEIYETGESNTLSAMDKLDYEEVPVDIDTFIDSPDYAGWFTGNGKNIYDFWRKKLREIFNGNENYTEIVFTGGIGTGKSHIAVLSLAYCLYKLMCLKDPYSYFNLAKGSFIYIVFFNATLQLSQGVAYSKFQSLLLNSPWFMSHGKMSGTKYLEYIPDKPIRFTVGSQMEHSIGKDIAYGILDEVNFVKGADIQFEKSKIMKLYASVLERINSRFIVRGKVEGKLFLVSSKKSEYDFIESYVKKQEGKPGIYIVDAKIWQTKPKGTYSGKWFKIAIGGLYKSSKIIGDDENPEDYERQGYQIMDIPIEMKKNFELDITTALMNVGVSVSNSMRFISYTNLSKCYKDHKNPFTMDIISTGLYDKLTLREFFKPEMVSQDISSRPIFIHIDTSLTGDRTGISAVAVMGFKNVNEYSIASGEIEQTKELYYHHIFTVGIECPSNSEISFQKTRDFIYYLKYELGWNIKGVSTDGFQSVDTRQQLITAGFENVDLVSLDKKPDGYLTYKNVINEQRISHLCIPKLEFEIINLARDNQTGKIDHDIDKCFVGETKVKLVDGRDLTIFELMQEQEYKTNWVYTFNEKMQKIEPKPIKKVFQTMITKDLVKVTLDNNESIICTPNHKFMLRDGSYKEAKDLVNGNELKSLSNQVNVYNVEPYNCEDTKVYDLEIEDNHNFALSAGIIVHNSKDLSDSLCGAVFNASLHEQELNLYMIDSHDIALEVNEWTNEDTTSQDLLSKLVTQKIDNIPIDNIPYRDSISKEEDVSGFFFM